MRIFIYILVFFMGMCGNFVMTIFAQESIQQNNFEKKFSYKKLPLWAEIQSGDFVPMRFLTLKKPILDERVYTDDKNILRYVGPRESLSDRNYRADDLVAMSGANINEAGRVSQIRREAKESVLKMAIEFREYFGEPLVAISAFRSAEYQQRLWDLGRCNDGAFCAKPGFSEHQLGLTVDFFDATSETQYLTNARYKSFYEWMKKNAYRYGWTQSYKHGPEIDGYEIEPWHWRYIGLEMAQKLHTLDISYTKYLSLSKMWQY